MSGIAARSEGAPRGSITVKGRGILHEDAETKAWFYPALALKSNPDNPAAAAAFVKRLDSPLRVILEVVPEKWITFDGAKSGAHRACSAGSGGPPGIPMSPRSMLIPSPAPRRWTASSAWATICRSG